MPYGCGPVKFNPRGEWDSGTAYGAYDVVTRNGSSYWAKLTPNVGNDPEVNSPDQWQLLARKGDTGEQGTQGDPGAAGATWHNGSGAPGGEVGIDGDYYLDTDSDDIYQKSSGSWSQIGNIRGQQGEQGEAGAGVEAGHISYFAGPEENLPEGWLKCDGSEVAIDDYPDLYTAIGTTWNTGGESEGNFRLPNLPDRVLVGASETRSVGEYGGEESHEISVDELPAHEHDGVPTEGQASGDIDLSVDVSGSAEGDVELGVSGNVDISYTTCCVCASNPDLSVVDCITGASLSCATACGCVSLSVSACGCASGSVSLAVSMTNFGNTGTTGSGQAVSLMQPYAVAIPIIRC